MHLGANGFDVFARSRLLSNLSRSHGVHGQGAVVGRFFVWQKIRDLSGLLSHLWLATVPDLLISFKTIMKKKSEYVVPESIHNSPPPNGRSLPITRNS